MQQGTSVRPRDRKVELSALLILCLMLFAAYCNTFQSPPALDDFHSFIDEPSVRVTTWSVEDLKRLSATVFGWGRWIPMISFSWDIWLGNGSLFQLHLTNLLIHLSAFLSVLFLVVVLARRAEENPDNSESPLNPSTLALWVAGLWALNPVHTSTITYLVQRMAAMMSLFFILSVAFYASGRSLVLKRGSYTSKSILCFALSFLCMLLAFLSKENSIMLPPTLACVELWFFRPHLIAEMWAFIRRRRILSLVGLMIVLVILYYKVPPLLTAYTYRHFTLSERLLTELRVVVWYISVVLWPDPGRLSLEHDFPISTSLIHPPSTLACLALLLAMIFWALRERRRFPLASFGIVWFFLNLAVESSFVPLELVFEHRVYLPSVGLVLSVVVLLRAALRRAFLQTSPANSRKLGWCLVAIIASGLTLATFSRNTVWENSVALAQHDARINPNCPRAHVNLAVMLNKAHRFQEALISAYRAVEVSRPNYEVYSVAANALVLAHSHLGDYETAIAEGERILRESPVGSDAGAVPITLVNIGRVHRKIMNLEDAYKAAKRAFNANQRLTPRKIPEFELMIIPLLADVYTAVKQEKTAVDFDQDGETDSLDMPMVTWIAEQFHQWGDRQTARRLLTQAVEEDPADQRASALLHTYEREDGLNRIQDEKKDFTNKYVLRPFSRFHACMAVAFLTEKRRLPSFFAGIGEAALEYALRLQPDSADARLLKAWYLYSANKTDKAIAQAQEALAVDPDYARAWLGLGFFYAKAGRRDEALDAFRKCLELYPGNPDRVAIAEITGRLKSGERQAANEPGPESSFHNPVHADSHDG